ncbi:MAG: hypothetical protein AAB554_01095 [Patescibacteria group bacterium]
MRHMIKTACSLMFLVAVQGVALADDMPIPGPPPATGGSCPPLTECQESLASCQEDVGTLLATDCGGAEADKIRKKYGVTPDTTVKVVKRKPKKLRKPVTPKTPPKASEAKPGPQGPIGPQGPAGPKGDDGTRGADGRSASIKVAVEASGKNCPAGGSHLMVDENGDGETDTDVYVCNGGAGKSGSNGRPGHDGNTRIQVGLGFRHSAVISKGRPTGYSAAPELQVEYWLSPTWEFQVGMAWAWGEDRNMVVTSELCRRGLDSMFGFCLGGQYQAWNLEGNLALWHSGLGTASLKFVPVDSKYVDLSFEAGPLVGFDGYDDDMQFAYGWTGTATLSGKF